MDVLPASHFPFVVDYRCHCAFPFENDKCFSHIYIGMNVQITKGHRDNLRERETKIRGVGH